MSKHIGFKPFLVGVLASLVLLAVYLLSLLLISGWEFTRESFAEFGHYVIALALGFGLQVGLYTYLKQVTRHTRDAGQVVAVSGATSGGAMIACCTHYLVNVVPVIGATGFIALVAQYQIELFWVGLVFNFAGLLYIGRKTWQAVQHMAMMEEQQ